MKDYLASELARNKAADDAFQVALRLAFGDCAGVLTVHHITFMREGAEPNEIPAADTLLFDHDIMGRIFGEERDSVLCKLALVPCERRDQLFRELVMKRLADECAP